MSVPHDGERALKELLRDAVDSHNSQGSNVPDSVRQSLLELRSRRYHESELTSI